MTLQISLTSKTELFRDLLYDGWGIGDLRYGIPDCNVMSSLKCSPQSWSRYRPQLIQYCKYNDLVKTETIQDVEMETIRITMIYDKKKKMWYGKRNPLLIKNEKGLWNEMTSEQQEKYDVLWGLKIFYTNTHHTIWFLH